MDSDLSSASPFYFPLRMKDRNTVRNLLDGVIWGSSNCFYVYYGAHPGKSGGTYIFDEFGRIKPVFHFFSAANNLLGGHQGVESFDDFDNLRIGLARTGENRGMLIMYSVDGKMYDFILKGTGITSVLDGLGNPLPFSPGDIKGHLSSYPTYLAVDNLDAIRETIREISFSETMPVHLTFSRHPLGMLNVSAVTRSSVKLDGSAMVPDVCSPDKLRRTEPRHIGGDLYAFDFAWDDNVKNSIECKFPLSVTCGTGEANAEYRIDYAAISHASKEGATDGVLSEGEWPALFQRISLHGYQYGEKKAERVRGNACLQIGGDSLRGMVYLDHARWETPRNIEIILSAIDPESAAPVPEKQISLCIADAGETVTCKISFNDQTLQREFAAEFPVSKCDKNNSSEKAEPWGPWYEFSIPMSRLQGIHDKTGNVYAMRIFAKDKKLEGKGWDLDAAWPKGAEQDDELWGRVMIISQGSGHGLHLNKEFEICCANRHVHYRRR